MSASRLTPQISARGISVGVIKLRSTATSCYGRNTGITLIKPDMPNSSLIIRCWSVITAMAMPTAMQRTSTAMQKQTGMGTAIPDSPTLVTERRSRLAVWA